MDVFNLVAKISLDTSSYDKSLNRAGSSLKSLGLGLNTKAVAFGNIISNVVSKATGALKGFAKETITTGMNFDTSMSQVAATMGKTVNDLSKEQETAVVRGKKFTGNLRDYAKFVGQETEYSAKQAADALNYMALAGYNTKQSMDMLPNVLNLASAGAMDMATASDRVTDAQTALGLSFKETTTMVDQMARVSSKTNTNVNQVSEAFLTVGASARSMKAGAIPTTKEMAMVFGAMADNGVKGAEAGTHLRNILTRFAKPTDDSAAAMKRLNVSAYDAQGNLRDLPDIFKEISRAEEGMTQKEKDATNSALFNKYDLAVVNALLGTTADRWDDIGKALDGASGSAEKMANTQLDNLNGDITLFKSALESVQIAITDKVKPALRSFVQIGTKGLSELAAAINKGDVGKIADAIGNTITRAANKAIEYLPKIMEVVVNIINAVTDATVKIIPEVLPKLIPALVQGAMKISAALVKNIPKIISSLIEGIKDSFDSPGDALASAFFLAFIVGLKKQPFGTALSGIFGNLGKIPEIFASLSSIVSGLTPILGGVTRAFAALNAVMMANPIVLVITLITALIASLVLLYNHNEKFRNFINGMFDGIKKGLATVGNAMKTFFTKSLPNFFSQVGQKFKTAGQNIASGFKSLGQTIAQKDRELGMQQRRILQNAIKSVSDYAKKSFAAQKKFFSNVGTGISNAFTTIGSTATKVFNNIRSGASSAFGAMQKHGSNAISNIKRNFSNTGSSIAKFFTKTIPNAASSAWKAISNFGNSAKNVFITIGKKGREAGMQINNAFLNAGKKIVNTFKGIPGKIAGFFSNIGKKFKDIGHNIVTGIWKGISGAGSWLKDKITGFGGSIVGWFKKTFKIGSPSKVMRDEVGQHIPTGVVKGIEKTQNKAKKSAEQLANEVVSTAQNIALSSDATSDSLADKLYNDIIGDADKAKKKATKKISSKKTKSSNASKLPSDEELEKMRQEEKKHPSYLGKYNNYGHDSSGRMQYVRDDDGRWILKSEKEKQDKEKEQEAKKKKSTTKSKKTTTTKKETSSKKETTKKDSKLTTREEQDNKLIASAQKRIKAMKAADRLTTQQEASFWMSIAKKTEQGSTAYYKALAKANNVRKKQTTQSLKDAEQQLSLSELKRNKKSATFEAAYWNKIRKQYKAGTSERLKADKKYYTARNKIGNETIKDIKKRYSDYKIYHKTTLADDVAYLNQSRKVFKKGTEERKKLDKEYFTKRNQLLKKQESAEKKYLKSVESAEKKYRSAKKAAEKALNESMTEALDTYNEKVTEINNSVSEKIKELLGNFSLTEKYDTGDVVEQDKLVENLDQQIRTLDDYANERQVLESKIKGTELYDTIEEMGLSGLQVIRALNRMSTEQLDKYVKSFSTRNQKAKEEINKQMADTVQSETAEAYKNYTDSVAKANETYTKALASAQKTYSNSIEKAYTTYSNSMEKIGGKVSSTAKKIRNTSKKTADSYSSNISKMSSKTKTAMNSISKKIGSTMGEVASSTLKFGQDAAENFANGFRSAGGKIGKAVSSVLKSQVWKKMHFSEPDEGPLSDFHTYAPDMIKLFASGIKDNAHLIGEALDNSIKVNDFSERVEDSMAPAFANASQSALNIPGLPQLTPIGGQQNSTDNRPVNLNITMKVGRTEFAKLVYQLNKEESQRVGLQLATGAI